MLHATCMEAISNEWCVGYTVMCSICPESPVGLAWRLKNEIPNSQMLDQVSGGGGGKKCCVHLRE